MTPRERHALLGITVIQHISAVGKCLVTVYYILHHIFSLK